MTTLGQPEAVPVSRGEANDLPLDEVISALTAQKYATRVTAVDRLLTSPGQYDAARVVPALTEVLREDKNEQLRKQVAEGLWVLGNAALEPLLEALQDDGEKSFIRGAAAGSLGRLGTASAADALAGVVASRTDLSLRHAAVGALRAIGGRDAGTRLVAALPMLENDELRARVVAEVGAIGAGDRAPETIAGLMDIRNGPRTAAAAIAALPKLVGPKAVPRLIDVASGSDEPRLRRRAVDQLGGLAAPTAAPLLCQCLLCDPDEAVRDAAAKALAALPPAPESIEVLLHCAKERALTPDAVDRRLIGVALGPMLQGSFPDGTTVTDHLLRAATDRTQSWPFLAELLVAVSGDSARAGDCLNTYERRHDLQPDALRWLRIELGGETALDPILERLRTDLRDYFQIPIHELNEQTRAQWEKTIADARRGFQARMLMSIAVFIAGLALLVLASVRFLFGDLTGTAAWGTGVSFVGGFGAMLLVVYTGPLRDIRQAVRDLGASSAIFIAYVHRVLQASHTFSALYLRDSMTFEEADHAARLMRSAMQDSVHELLASDQDDRKD